MNSHSWSTRNFEELARRYPEFLEAWKDVQDKQHQAAKGKANFSSCTTQEFSITLARGLLHAYFDLRLPHLPSNHLCPPVPNRFFYLHRIDTHLLKAKTRSKNVTAWILGSAQLAYTLVGCKSFSVSYGWHRD